MAKKKGNKEALATVNFSINTVRDIQSGKNFTEQEKSDILYKFTGMSTDNNSYWTPVSICNFMKQLLNIPTTKKIKLADLSAGIGNMAIPYITQYGKLQDNITFDLFELDSNTSIAGEMAWSDYSQVTYHGNFDSINGDIPDNYYDYILGNPPFTGSIKYLNSEWCCTKTKTTTRAKNANIADAFVDLAINKTKDKGYIALVLPMGHLSNGKGTEKLRQYMKSQVALKFICYLDSDTFSKAGLTGTSVPTALCIFQKGVKQGKIFMGELSEQNKDLEIEIQSMAEQFIKFNTDNYKIRYQSDYLNGMHATLI